MSIGSILGILGIVQTLLPMVIRVMNTVEQVLGAGTGTQKKEIVMGAAQYFLEGMTEVSTGGQKETWEGLAGPMSMLIDALAAILFPNKEAV